MSEPDALVRYDATGQETGRWPACSGWADTTQVYRSGTNDILCSYMAEPPFGRPPSGDLTVDVVDGDFNLLSRKRCVTYDNFLPQFFDPKTADSNAYCKTVAVP